MPGSRGTEVLVDLRVAVGTIGLSRQHGQPAGVGAYRAARRLPEDLQVPFGVIWTAWWSDRAQYGGMLQAMSSHLIDFLLWTCGDITSLSGRVDAFIRSRQTADGTAREVTSDDQNAALLRFAAAPPASST